MKKLLALVLALVMTMGLATVATNAAFPDAADVSLNEAVDVMSAVGVFQGNENGNFLPKANLDRASAAKLIAYLDLGEKTAEALPAAQVFPDVPANHWASKYIAYCKNAGYIGGDANGNFLPATALNGYSFGKMLLCVLGYDSNIEGFTGSTWSINVAKLMQSNDITDGIDTAASETLTREQGAQYCFNAIQQTTVTYASKGTSIEINGATIATGASSASKTGNDTLMTKLYGAKLVSSASDGDFGADSTTWTYEGKKIGSYETESPVLTYTTSLKEKELFTALGVDGISGKFSKYVVLDEIWVDGVKVAVSEHVADGDYYQAKASASVDSYEDTVIIAKGDSSNMAGPGNGVITKIYAVEDSNGDAVANHYKMVCAKQYLTKITSVTKANATAGTDRYVTTAYGTFDTEDFAKSDKVVITKGNDGIATMELATVVENVAVSAYTTTSVTAGGTTYKYSQECNAFTGKGAYSMSSGNTYTFYLDPTGYIVDGELYEGTSADYCYIAGVGAPEKNDFADDYTVKYQVVGMDGKISTIKAIDANSTADFAQNDIITFEDDSDNEGYVTITKLGAYDANESSTAGYLASSATVTSFSKTAASVSGLTFNNSTLFVIKTGKNTYKVVSGLSKMDNWSSISTTIYTVTKSGVATVAFMDCYNSGNGASSSTADELVYVIDTGATSSYDSDIKKTIYTYKTVDGTISVVSSSVINAEGLWKITGTESGYVKTATAVATSGKYTVDSALASTAGKVEYDDGTLTIGSKSYVVASDVSVTIVDTDDNVTTDADVEALTGDAVKGTFTLIAASTSDATVKTIYFNGTIE